MSSYPTLTNDDLFDAARELTGWTSVGGDGNKSWEPIVLTKTVSGVLVTFDTQYGRIHGGGASVMLFDQHPEIHSALLSHGRDLVRAQDAA